MSDDDCTGSTPNRDQQNARGIGIPTEGGRIGAWDGPFKAGKCMVVSDDDYDGAAVFDATGEPFAFVTDDMAVGGRPGAIARATRIAECLNRDQHLFERRLADAP